MSDEMKNLAMKMAKEMGTKKGSALGKRLLGGLMGRKFKELEEKGVTHDDAILDTCIEILQQQIQTALKMKEEFGAEIKKMELMTDLQKLCVVARNSHSGEIKMIFGIIFYTFMLNSVSPLHLWGFAEKITQTCSELMTYGIDVAEEKETEDLDKLFDVFRKVHD